MSRVRVEVERFAADGLHTSYALNVDPPELDPAAAQRAHELIEEFLDDVRAMGVPDPAATAAGVLVELLAEDRIYERVAARRGVLAL